MRIHQQTLILLLIIAFERYTQIQRHDRENKLVYRSKLHGSDDACSKMSETSRRFQSRSSDERVIRFTEVIKISNLLRLELKTCRLSTGLASECWMVIIIFIYHSFSGDEFK